MVPFALVSGVSGAEIASTDVADPEENHPQRQPWPTSTALQRGQGVQTGWLCQKRRDAPVPEHVSAEGEARTLRAGHVGTECEEGAQEDGCTDAAAHTPVLLEPEDYAWEEGKAAEDTVEVGRGVLPGEEELAGGYRNTDLPTFEEALRTPIVHPVEQASEQDANILVAEVVPSFEHGAEEGGHTVANSHEPEVKFFAA